ncbi:hypothetical protein HU200_033518 [Digitaria exilis]|uniref:Uncharacterized protein n=1 Tax=Digitaria exilis TaxID=1010633 RepID=A0A835ER77_9POAL|nr:hypothetical protein HU200_033518 [Digitaria exilis]
MGGILMVSLGRLPGDAGDSPAILSDGDTVYDRFGPFASVSSPSVVGEFFLVMANFAIDLHLHVPRGFEVLPRDPNAHPSRLHAYIGGVLNACNKDLAIAFLLSAVTKEDIRELAEVLKHFFAQDQGSTWLHWSSPLPLPLVPYSSFDDDSMVEISSPPARSTPCWCRHHLLKEPLDDAFLRQSARLHQPQGFKDNASAEKAAANPSVYVAQPGEGSTAAPHLSIENI